MSETKQIIINLEKTSETFGFSANELLQIEEYEKFYQTLEELHEQKKRMRMRENIKGRSVLEEISQCQVHDAIFISGERGTGKTTFLHSIKEFVNSKSTDNNKYKFLPIIDPTLLHYNEEFLVITISHIVNYMEYNYFQCSQSDVKKREFYSLLKDISESINSISNNDSVIERMIKSQNSLQLEQKVHEFFKVITEICNCEMIVLPIDDIDMSFSHGFNVLETIRKFLSSPYIVPVVSGAPELYATIVEKQFTKKVYSKFIDEAKLSDSLLLGQASIDSQKISSHTDYLSKHTTLAGINPLNWKQEVRALSDRYFAKVFPVDKRINLPSIGEILKRYMSRLMVKSSNDTLTSLEEIYITFCRTFNAPISWKGFLDNEHAYNPIPHDSLRSFTQYFSKMKKIIEIGKNFKLPRRYTGQAIRAFFEYTEDFYYNIHDKQFEYLCAKASSRKPVEPKSIRNILYSEFFDRAYNPHKKPILEEVIKNKNLHFIQREKCHNLLGLGGLTQFYTDIFTYRDYYSSYQQKYFIVAGKFIEFIWRSLDYSFGSGEKNKFSEYKEIIEAKQQYKKGRRSAFLNILPNNYFELSDSDKNEDEINNDNDITEYSSSEEQLYIYLEELLVGWQKKYSYDETSISSAFVYKSTNKFLHNLNRMHNQNISESVISYIKRVCWIFLNSIAFFERVNTGESISETNIALSKLTPELDTLRMQSSAYKMNIAPLLEDKDSLTYCLYNHPLIYMVIENKFPDYLKEDSMFSTVFLNKLQECKLGSGKNKEDIDKQYKEQLIDDISAINRSKGAKNKVKLLKILIEKLENNFNKDDILLIAERIDNAPSTKKIFDNPEEHKDLISKFRELRKKAESNEKPKS